MKQPPGFTPPPGQAIPHDPGQLDLFLDEALEESFPASDPIAVDARARPKTESCPPAEKPD